MDLRSMCACPLRNKRLDDSSERKGSLTWRQLTFSQSALVVFMTSQRRRRSFIMYLCPSTACECGVCTTWPKFYPTIVFFLSHTHDSHICSRHKSRLAEIWAEKLVGYIAATRLRRSHRRGAAWWCFHAHIVKNIFCATQGRLRKSETICGRNDKFWTAHNANPDKIQSIWNL